MPFLAADFPCSAALTGKKIGDFRAPASRKERRSQTNSAWAGTIENPHQLRYRHRRMRIVQLDGDLLGKCAPIGVAVPESPDQIGQQASDQKISLDEAQSTP